MFKIIGKEGGELSMPNPTVKITRNRYGNFRGRTTGNFLTTELGCSEYDAIAWASEKLEANPDAELHPDSCITENQIIAYRDALKP